MCIKIHFTIAVFALSTIFSSVSFAKSYWLAGGLIGAGAGFGAGLGIGLAAGCSNAGNNNEDCDISKSTLTAITTTTGTATGFGLGTLIGSFIKKKDKTAFFTPNLLIDPVNEAYIAGGCFNF